MDGLCFTVANNSIKDTEILVCNLLEDPLLSVRHASYDQIDFSKNLGVFMSKDIFAFLRIRSVEKIQNQSLPVFYSALLGIRFPLPKYGIPNKNGLSNTSPIRLNSSIHNDIPGTRLSELCDIHEELRYLSDCEIKVRQQQGTDDLLKVIKPRWKSIDDAFRLLKQIS